MQKIKIGLSGLGNFGELESEILHQINGVTLNSFCSSSEERLEEFGRKFNAKNLYTEFDDMVKNEDIDAIFITTSSKKHADQAIKALEHQKPVFVEKPLALDYNKGKQVVKTAEEKNLFLMVGFQSRFDKKLLKLKESIDNGQLGPVLYMNFHRSCSKSLFLKGAYVNPVMETMIHDIDLALWLAGSRNVVEVQSDEISSKNNSSHKMYLAWLKFNNGIRVILETDWFIPEGSPKNISSSDRTLNSRIKVVGENGRANVNLLNNSLIISNHENTYLPMTGLSDRIGSKIYGALRRELEHFIMCVRSDSDSSVASYHDALYGLKIAGEILNS